MTDLRQPQPPQTPKSYVGGIQARTSARQEERRRNPVFPNLAEAAITQRGSQEPTTLQEVAAQQRADAENPDAAAQKRGLSEETIQGLAAVRREQDRVAEAQAKQQASAVAEALPGALPKKESLEEELEDEVGLEDAALVKAIRAAREDTTRSERERIAVAARVKEIDLASGLLNNEFTQLVPIVPGKLTVKFRCLTTAEYDALRLYLIKRVGEDEALNNIAPSLLSFYQTVASVVSINDTTYAAHMIAVSASSGVSFSELAFAAKVRQFSAFPAPLVASLNAHGVWFEQRVRDLFVTAEALKNG